MENLTCYCIVSENNNRTYVGATNNFDKRISLSTSKRVSLQCNETKKITEKSIEYNEQKINDFDQLLT